MQSFDESRFEVLGRLGRGGTAEVFRVRIENSSVQGALKCPLPDPAPTIDFSKLATREVALIGGSRFPGLVRILEHSDTQPGYLLLEICEGNTLDSLGRIDNLSLALNLLSALAIDLHFLKLREIVHGDLKPQNFFLPRDLKAISDGKVSYVKLSDFSLGRYEDEPESARAGLGTVGYMAPETIVEGRSSHKSDLFALGVIAYQLLTGIHPFIDGETDPVRINGRIREETPQPLEEVRPDIPPAICQIVTALLAKDEKSRPDAALEVCQILADAGATYPYTRALSARQLINADMNYQKALQLLPGLSYRQASRLEMITGRNERQLQVLLDANLRHGTLHLANTGYHFSREIYWPSRMRRTALKKISHLTYSAKREAIRAAIAADATSEHEMTAPSVTRKSALQQLLLHLLRQQTVKRVSSRLAQESEQREQYEAATRLYLQSGNLEGADRCAYQAAAALKHQHQTALAVLCINSVLRYAAMKDQLPSVRALLMLKGDIQKDAGDIDEALSTYQQIVQIYGVIPPDKILAETFKDLGDIYKMKQDATAGLDSLRQALEIFRQLGDELEVSRTLNNIGNNYFYAGNLPETLKHYRKALRVQRRLEAITEVASTLTNIGTVYCVKGRYTRGVLLLRTSLQIKKELGNLGEIARTYNNLGYAYHVLGRYDESLSSLTESLEINRRIGNKKEILINLESLVNLGLTAGFLKDSLGHLQEGLNLAAELDDKPHQAFFYHLLSIAYLRMGRLAEAQQALDAASAILPAIDDPQLPCNIEATSGNIRFAVSDEAGAKKHWEAAYKLATANDNAPLALSAQLELLRLGIGTEVLGAIEKRSAELGLTREQQLIPFNYAEFLLDHEMSPQALQLLPTLSETLQSLTIDIDSARLHGIVAELLAAKQQFTEAKALLAKGLQHAQLSGLKPEMARCLTLAAQIESREGNLEDAFAKYRQALQLYKQIADTLDNDTDRSFFQGKRSIRFLVEEIRRLGKLLEQKQRAG